MYYEDIFSQLDSAKVKYLVVGGMAINLYGIPRMTADLDLMLSPEKENLDKLVSILKELGYKPRVPVKLEDFINAENREKWRKEKNMVMFTVVNPDLPFQEVDIFLSNPIDFAEAYAHRQVIKAKGFNISLLSIEHLIALKEISAREQDLSDITALKQLKIILKEES